MLKKLFSLLIFAAIGLSRAEGQDIPKWKVRDLDSFIKNVNRPTVVNFWATYCKPCIEEIPHFQKLVNKYAPDSVQLLLVSLDMEEMYPEQIATFAGKLQITAPIVFLDESNADVFCPVVDQKWSGAIPASLFINNKTGYRKFFEKPIPEQEFESALESLVAVPATKKPAIMPVLLISIIVLFSLVVLFRIRRTAKS